MSQKKDTIRILLEPQNPNQNVVLWMLGHGHDLGVLYPAIDKVLVRNDTNYSGDIFLQVWFRLPVEGDDGYW